ncbi:MAG: TlpA family protein disulfide reductase [Nitrospirae bacterium]|nr:TlpA family protein disulfide reductase [Nitrospirota bacterium]
MAAILFSCTWQSYASGETGTTIGKYAPDFELRDINGKRVTLYEFKGKVVLVNFWATYCGPCISEMPSMNNLYLTFKDKGFVVIAVSINSSMSSVKSFAAENKLAFHIVMDLDRKVYSKFAVRGIPASFLIDKNGIIMDRIMGEEEWDSSDMKNKILRLLK